MNTQYCGRRGKRAGTTHGMLPRIALAVLLVATFAVCVRGVLIRAESRNPDSWTTIAVAANGTLWEIAASHPVEGLTTAESVELIQAENCLASGTVYVGQTLRVPGAAEQRELTVAQR